MRSNNVKPKFVGYIVVKIDSSEYPQDLIIKDSFRLITWNTLISNTNPFDTVKEAKHINNLVKDEIRIKHKVKQLFRVCDNLYDAVNISNKYKFTTRSYSLVSF